MRNRSSFIIYCICSGSVIDPSDESVIVKKIIKQVQENQRKALIVSPVSLVSAIVLYGRATGGVSFGMFL